MSSTLENRYTTFSVNGKTSGAVPLFVTENGVELFHPLWVSFTLTAASAITTPCTLSIGTNGATFNNILVATALTGLTVLNTTISQIVSPNAVLVPVNTQISLNITVVAVATTMVFNVAMGGYYE